MPALQVNQILPYAGYDSGYQNPSDPTIRNISGHNNLKPKLNLKTCVLHGIMAVCCVSHVSVSVSTRNSADTQICGVILGCQLFWDASQPWHQVSHGISSSWHPWPDFYVITLSDVLFWHALVITMSFCEDTLSVVGQLFLFVILIQF